MAAIEVWLHGGPADGRIQLVELVVDELPEVVRLRQSGMYAGSADNPLPSIEHVYRRARGHDTDDYPVYLHDSGGRADQ